MLPLHVLAQGNALLARVARQRTGSSCKRKFWKFTVLSPSIASIYVQLAADDASLPLAKSTGRLAVTRQLVG